MKKFSILTQTGNFFYFQKKFSQFRFRTSAQRGQLLIELLLAIGLSAIILPGIVAGITATRSGRVQQRERMQALTYVKQAHEALRSIRERGWDNIYGPGTYYPTLSLDGKQWELATGSATVNGFTTAIAITDVYRSSGAIVLSPTPGTLDRSTKRALITVSWLNPIPSAISSTIYLTRYLENDSYTETTQAQFNSGVKSGTTVQATNPPSVSNDGEVVLGAGGNSDWCQPSLVTNTIDLPGSGYPSSIAASEGKAYVGTGENASGLAYMDVSISNTHPPAATLGETFDGHKTNAIWGEPGYAYIATDTNAKEIVIVGIGSSPFSEAGYFNAPGNGTATGVYVLGDKGYMTVGDKLYNFDLSSKTGSRPGIDTDGVTLAGTGYNLVVIGNYAYVSTNGTNAELQIIDVSNASNLTIVGQANVNGNGGRAVYVDASGNRTYLVTSASSTQSEFFIIDTSGKTGDRPVVGSYNSNYNGTVGDTTAKGVTVVPGNRAIMVGNGGEEYQVINISSESSPSHCGGVEVNDGITGVASVLEADGDAYSYIVTGEASAEFKIIEGGPGGTYVSTGIFESAVFNPGYATANNRFSATYTQPANTTIRFQVTLAALVDGSCPVTGGYTFIGPDGTSGTYFTPASGESVPFPLTGSGNYANPGQCFRYKVYMSSTNQNSTPVLHDFTINYSP